MLQCWETVMQSRNPSCGGLLGMFMIMGGDPQPTMTCLTNMKSSLPSTCQAMVERLNTNSLGVNLLACSQKAMQMCMDTQQIMQILSKLKANEQVSLEPEFYTDLFKCYNSKTSELSTGCQELVQKNLATKSTGSSSSTKSDDCDPGEAGCEDKEKKSGRSSTAFAVLFFLCVLGFCGSSFAAVYFYRKTQEAPSAMINDVELAAVEERESLAMKDAE